MSFQPQQPRHQRHEGDSDLPPTSDRIAETAEGRSLGLHGSIRRWRWPPAEWFRAGRSASGNSARRPGNTCEVPLRSHAALVERGLPPSRRTLAAPIAAGLASCSGLASSGMRPHCCRSTLNCAGVVPGLSQTVGAHAGSPPMETTNNNDPIVRIFLPHAEPPRRHG